MAKCAGVTIDGAACRVPISADAKWCRWHNPSPEARTAHREASQRGGLTKAYGALPTSESLWQSVSTLDLTTATGLSYFLAATLQRLATLPFDTRVAHAIASVMNTQKGAVELAQIESRISRLEQDAGD